MHQVDLAAPQALAALLLQATCGSFALLWLMPPEAGRQFYSTIGKALSPIAWVVTLIAYGLREHLPSSAVIAIGIVALCVTVYTYGILHDNPLVNVVPTSSEPWRASSLFGRPPNRIGSLACTPLQVLCSAGRRRSG